MTSPATQDPQGGRQRDGLAQIDVVMCCADEDLEAVVSTFSGLASDGLAPRVLSGVELDTRPLARAVEQALDPTMFVVCSGAALDRYQVRRLVEVFSRSHGSRHRLLVVELDPRRPHALLCTVQAAAHGWRRRGGPYQPLETHSRLTPPPRVASVRVIEGGDQPPDPRSDGESSRLCDVVGRIPDSLPATSSATARPRLTVVRDAGPSEAEDPGERDEAADLLEDADAGGESDGPLSGLDAIDLAATLASLEGLEVRERPVAEAVAAGVPDAPAQVVTPPSPGSRWRPRRGLAAVLLLAVAAVWSLVVVEASRPIAGAATAGLAEISGVAGGLVFDHHPGVLLSRPRADDSTPPEELEDPQALDDLLASGRIRDLDGLLVSTPSVAAGDWWSAANRCRARGAAGFHDWRLPWPSELRALRRRKLVRGGRWWSISRVVGADQPSNWLLETEKARMRAAVKSEHARAICVRPR